MQVEINKNHLQFGGIFASIIFFLFVVVPWLHYNTAEFWLGREPRVPEGIIEYIGLAWIGAFMLSLAAILFFFIAVMVIFAVSVFSLWMMSLCGNEWASNKLSNVELPDLP